MCADMAGVSKVLKFLLSHLTQYYILYIVVEKNGISQSVELKSIHCNERADFHENSCFQPNFDVYFDIFEQRDVFLGLHYDIIEGNPLLHSNFLSVCFETSNQKAGEVMRR